MVTIKKIRNAWLVRENSGHVSAFGSEKDALKFYKIAEKHHPKREKKTFNFFGGW